MIVTLLLAVAGAATASVPDGFPESVRLEDLSFKVALTCHFTNARFVFEGVDLTIEDLENGEVTERHLLEDSRLLATVLGPVLEDSFLRDPEVVEGRHSVALDDRIERFEVATTTECRATLELTAPGFHKRTEYRSQEGIPGRIDEMLERIHFQATTGQAIDPFEGE